MDIKKLVTSVINDNEDEIKDAIKTEYKAGKLDYFSEEILAYWRNDLIRFGKSKSFHSLEIGKLSVKKTNVLGDKEYPVRVHCEIEFDYCRSYSQGGVTKFFPYDPTVCPDEETYKKKFGELENKSQKTPNNESDELIEVESKKTENSLIKERDEKSRTQGIPIPPFMMPSRRESNNEVDDSLVKKEVEKERKKNTFKAVVSIDFNIDAIKLGENDDDETLYLTKLAKLDSVALDKSFKLKIDSLDKARKYSRAISKKYRLDEKGEKSLLELTTYRYREVNNIVSHEEIKKAYYNMLVRVDDQGRGKEFIDEMCIGFGNGFGKIIYISEKVALATSNEKLLTDYISEKLEDIADNDVVVIEDCVRRPIVDEEAGTGSVNEKQKAELRMYNRFWKTLSDLSVASPTNTMIVLINSLYYQNSFEPNNELNHRIWGHRIFLPEDSVDEIYEKVVNALKQSSLKFSKNYCAELKKYLYAIYKKADLKGTPFVDDLINRITTLHFRKEECGDCLDIDSIPNYSDDVKSSETIIGELNNLVGLASVKKEIRGLYNAAVAENGRDKTKMYHMMFHGNPGTGKTTVAEMLAEIYYNAGLCDKKEAVCVKANDLVSKWGSGTAAKLTSVLEDAYGGILFIDEAYSLLSYGDRGQQVLDLLNKEMDTNRDKIIIILAGYRKELEKLFDSNSGLVSRITHIYFENYTIEELNEIFMKKCKENGFKVDYSCKESIKEYFASKLPLEYFANGREAETLFMKLKESWAADFADQATKYGRDNVNLEKKFYSKHFKDILPSKDGMSIKELVGLKTVKKQIDDFKAQILYQKVISEKGIDTPVSSMHMVFAGNPGTGKTTVAKIIANDLYRVGVLKNNKLTVVTQKDLVSFGNGESSKATNTVITKAAGGVLFIDEAYSLAESGSGGREAIETLLTAMEDHKADTIIILAGYTNEMKRLLNSNPGLISRIGFHFSFEDYTVSELTKIFFSKMEKAGFVVNKNVTPKVKEVMNYFLDGDNFGNGRFVEHVIGMTIAKRAKAERGYAVTYNDIEAEDIPSCDEIIDTAADKEYMYSPDKITEDEKRRTAIHELGHAIISYALDPSLILDSISINSRSKSLGRVTMPNRAKANMTETELKNRICILLAGRNAERAFFGCSDTGCWSDYAKAKRLSAAMINDYAMGEIGVTRPKDLLIQCDKQVNEIIEDYREVFEDITKKLLEGKEIKGKAFKKIMDAHAKKLNKKKTTKDNSTTKKDANKDTDQNKK